MVGSGRYLSRPAARRYGGLVANEPPRITRVSPVSGPVGLASLSRSTYARLSYQSPTHSQTLPAMSIAP